MYCSCASTSAAAAAASWFVLALAGSTLVGVGYTGMSSRFKQGVDTGTFTSRTSRLVTVRGGASGVVAHPVTSKATQNSVSFFTGTLR